MIEVLESFVSISGLEKIYKIRNVKRSMWTSSRERAMAGI